MAEIGDIVEVESEKVGSKPRSGLVTSVNGSMMGVRWTTGEVSTFVPAAGSLRVIGHEATPGSG